MKKTRSKIIIKTRAGGYAKIYANGKWQKKVCVIDYRAECSNKDGIKVTCEFDKLKTDKNGSAIYDEDKKRFCKRTRSCKNLGVGLWNIKTQCFVVDIATN